MAKIQFSTFLFRFFHKIPQISVFLWVFIRCDTPQRTFSLHFALPSAITTIDPIYASSQYRIWLTQQIFETLLTLDTNLHIRPCIAKKWWIAKDGRTYYFVLPRKIPLHPNPYQKHLTIDDVVFSFYRLCQPRWGSPGAWVLLNTVEGAEAYYQGKSTSIKGITAVNDTLLRIQLKRPFAPFLYLLTMPYLAIVPKKILSKHRQWFQKYPIGSGPYQVMQWQPQRYVILTATQHPKIKKQSPKKIFITLNPNITMNTIAFFKGEQDLLFKVDKPFLKGYHENPHASNITHFTIEELGIEYIGIRQDKHRCLKKKLFRKALIAALPLEVIVKHWLLKEGIAARSGFIPDGIPGSHLRYAQFPAYNPIKAMQWIEVCGCKEARLTILTTPQRQSLALLLKHYWEQIGLHIAIEVLEGATQRAAVRQGKAQLWTASWLADYPEGENFMALFYSKNHSPQGPNTTHFSHAVLDSLYEHALKTLQPQQRWKLYAKMDSIIKTTLPIIPLYYYRTTWLYRKDKIQALPKQVISTFFPMWEIKLKK